MKIDGSLLEKVLPIIKDANIVAVGFSLGASVLVTVSQNLGDAVVRWGSEGMTELVRIFEPYFRAGSLGLKKERSVQSAEWFELCAKKAEAKASKAKALADEAKAAAEEAKAVARAAGAIG